jgi:putative oxidoreductase
MKKLLTANENTNGVDVALLIARVSIAVLMLTHGLPKLGMLLSGEPIQFPALFGLTAGMSLGLTVFAEVICSLLILVGLATRLAVIPLGITMLVALFVIHVADPLAKQEPALQYLLVYVVLFFAGSGKYSVDYLLQKRSFTGGNENNPVLSFQ